MEITQLIGTENTQLGPKRTQVWLATHEEGGKRLPLMRRSFISFIYDGKYSEDMGVLSVVSGDRMERNLYADFGDNTTESDVLDGQYYWSTHFKTNTLSLTLATDEITEKQLDEIKRWLRPGPPRLLILSEHPFRGTYARISSTPKYSMLPFEEKITLKVAGANVNTSTTVYRGDIEVEFVMDEPFWFSLNNILDVKVNGAYNPGYWVDAQGDHSLILLDQDAVKVIQEDQIAASAMIASEDMFFGNNVMAYLQEQHTIEQPTTQEEYNNWLTEDIGEGNSRLAPDFDPTNQKKLQTHKITEDGYAGYALKYAIVGYGHLGNMLIELNENNCPGIDAVDSQNPVNPTVLYLYYPGTAPARPIISFNLVPNYTITTDQDTGQEWIMINSPKTEGDYNTITFESENKYELKFIAPSLYIAYNQAMTILHNWAGEDEIELFNLIKDGVNHQAVRKNTLALLTYAKVSKMGNWAAYAYNNLYQMFQSTSVRNDPLFSVKININLLTGRITMNTSIREFVGVKEKSKTGDEEHVVYRWNTATTLNEDVGNMLISTNFSLNDRNHPDENGFIQEWGTNIETGEHYAAGEETLESKQYSYKITHNIAQGLQNFSVQYPINYY